MGDPQLISRARGALLGLVAGNQLGVPTEHLGTPEAIRNAFPGGVVDLAPPPKNSPYDDDAAMALLLGESLLASRDFDAADVARRWVKWMKVDGRGIGVTTRRALTLIERCTWGAAAVNLAARELLHGNIYFIEEVLHKIGDRAPRALRDAIHRVPREQESTLPIAVPGEAGYVVHCVEIAFWFVAHDRTLEEALTYLVQAGGDTDTNAAVAGALLGARYGEVALPPRWVDQLVGAQGIAKLAENLVRGA